MKRIKSTTDFVDSILDDLEKKSFMSEEDKQLLRSNYFNVPPPPPPPFSDYYNNNNQNLPDWNENKPLNNNSAINNPSAAFPPNNIIVEHRLNEAIQSIFLAAQLEFKKKFDTEDKEFIKQEFIPFFEQLLNQFKVKYYQS